MVPIRIAVVVIIVPFLNQPLPLCTSVRNVTPTGCEPAFQFAPDLLQLRGSRLEDAGVDAAFRRLGR